MTIKKFYNLEHALDNIHPSEKMFMDMLKSSVDFNSRMTWNLYCKLYIEFAKDVFNTWRKLAKKPELIVINDGAVEFIYKDSAKVVTLSFCVGKSLNGWYSYCHSVKSRNLDFIEKVKLRLF